MDKLILIKRIRHIQSLLDGACNATTGMPEEVYESARLMQDLQDYIADDTPKTFRDVVEGNSGTFRYWNGS